MPSAPKPRLGISACLLGQAVRYDGGHKRDALCVELLGPLVEWVPVCPEVEVGMGVPREAVRLVSRLVGPGAAPRLVAVGGTDWTARMEAMAEARVQALAALDLAGYVTKQGSPSCGLDGVPLEDPAGGPPRQDGVGAFVRVLIARLPDLPVEEEDRLQDPVLRERFLQRVFRRARAMDPPCSGG